MEKVKVGIIGSGNIGTDLMLKVMRLSHNLQMGALVGIDPNSDGLKRAAKMNVPTTAEGIDGLISLPEFDAIRIVFDATSAGAHAVHDEKLRAAGKQVIDLTPAAIGPYTVPSVNLDRNLEQTNVSMVTCGGQATIPMVAAVSRITTVHYAEIVASISSRSAGPGTRANIDEFTHTTSRALEEVGGARLAKAIIVLNPAEPPMIMRDTIYCLCDLADEEAIRASVHEMVAEVRRYVPGYRLKQDVQFGHLDTADAALPPGVGEGSIKVSIFLEVEGAAHYLPAYAGNLDIMTSAALQTAERLCKWRGWGGGP